MPYNHYSSTDLYSQFTNYFRSNLGAPRIFKYKYNLYNNATNALLSSKDLLQTQSPGINPYVKNGVIGGYLVDTIIGSPSLAGMHFPSPLTQTTEFKIEHIIYESNNAFAFNDTVYHLQKFSNYFSHDDGTAEQGYYLNYFGAKTAVKYKLNIADTLKALNIYFDPIVNGNLIQSSSFRLMVWSDAGSGPGNLIYKDSLMYPKYIQGSYNLIPSYTLTSCLPLTAGSYYFGIQQTSNVALNIGFDKNTNHKNKLFYDIGNGWSQSNQNGALMINPVMGCVEAVIISVKENANLISELNVFPNPANNTITITLTKQVSNASIKINSIFGQSIYQSDFQNNQTIDVSHLSNGIYIATVISEGNVIARKKIIISK